MSESVNRALDQVIRRLVFAGMDADAATDQAIEWLTAAPERVIEYVRPLVELRAKNFVRSRVRGNEKKAFGTYEGAGNGNARMTKDEAVRELVENGFALPDGRWVSWGDATIKDHKDRAGWMRKQSEGLLETAYRHDAAVALLKKLKATCLRDVPNWDALLERTAA